jgi:ssDNA-binding Zn-finger/Zn-ribbon topoisomerase 1
MGVIEAGFGVAAVIGLAVLGWGVFVYFSPYRKCRWCQAFARFRLRCRRCGGSKLTRRLGARHAHRVKLALQQAWEER